MNAAVLLPSLALLSGVIGAGFASGREIIRFFAVHGKASFAAIVCALLSLSFFFLRLCAQMEYAGCTSLVALCRHRLGRKLGAICTALFFLLSAVTGGAMLSACAEIGALLFPVRHAYVLTLAASLILSLFLAHWETGGLALPGAVLCVVLPALLIPLLSVSKGEACFLPAIAPDLPIRAVSDGIAYGALNAAMMAGMLPLLLQLPSRSRWISVCLFALLFGSLLSLAVFVCQNHMAEIYMQPMPFVYLSRSLGKRGYLLLCACMLSASFSTLLAMLCSMRRLLPFSFGSSHTSLVLCAFLCLLFALIGFGPLVSSGYPVLGALCTGLLIILCLPGCPTAINK